MMIIGSIRAQKPSISARQISVKLLRGRRAGFSLRTTHHQAKHRPTPSSRPGTMPARNSFEIETLAATPKMTKPIDGGMTGAMIPPAATRPAALARLWPAAAIIGTRSAPSAAASATAEPESEARMHDVRIAT
ncbi:hypothetical protein ABID65_004564 [Bradyrhizobium sp. S3.9.2]